MAISIERAREILGPEYDKVSDEYIQDMMDQGLQYCNFILDWVERHPDHILKGKPKELEPIFNKERHQANSMPMKGSLDDKIKRHIEHVVHCKCRPIPHKIKKEIEKRIK